MSFNPFSMVVAIVFIGCFFELAKRWIDTRADARRARDSGPSDDTLDLIGRLEHRIEVLERIVTDTGYDLKKEIDRL